MQNNFFYQIEIISKDTWIELLSYKYLVAKFVQVDFFIFHVNYDMKDINVLAYLLNAQ